MVLPGIQALFGFQLTVVFQPAFSGKLSAGQQHLHLAAIGLLALSIALVMSPAAYHRQTDPLEVTAHFIRVATRLLIASMGPLAISLCIDFYLVGQVIYSGLLIPILATALFAIIILLWFVIPRVHALKWLIAGRQ
ncbi:MAG: hypothetical protein JWL90_4030 [Chthoniobacteraceae bacterium]|nr:hypothetical protein [Chthoniobacteraceae bacterium]